MLDRYTLPEMHDLWSLQNKYDTWLRVELAVVEAQAEIGRIPRTEADAIIRGARFSLDRALEIEETTHHDLLGFVGAVLENLGPEGRYFHHGVTSYDIEDPALAIMMMAGLELIFVKLDKLIQVVSGLAKDHKHTPMIGRTHGVHAEPITFGFKLAGWIAELLRRKELLEYVESTIEYGKISGAVGTHANIDPRVEAIALGRLGLRVDAAATQIIARDRHAEVLMALAILSASVVKFATEVRNLQRTEIHEVEENFAAGQRGSSAMPHKRNPKTSEQVAGLGRVVQGHVIPALDNMVTWHERDLTNSSVERVIVADMFSLVHYQLETFAGVMSKLGVFPDRMLRNLGLTRGLIYSEQVLLALTGKEVGRDAAYRLVQRAAHSKPEEMDFIDYLMGCTEVRQHLSAEEIVACFDLTHHFRNLKVTFDYVSI